MDDYISREAALTAIQHLFPCVPLVTINLRKWQEKEAPYHECMKAIERIPAADVRPVVKARWKPRDLTHGRQYYYCTSCEETVDMPTAMGIPLFNYCPNCGAEMRSTDR